MLVSLRRPLCQLVRIAHRFFFFFFNDTATTEIYTLSLHDALPISAADLPDHRLGGADSARNAAVGAGPCARRRVRRGRDLRRGTCAERPPRLRHRSEEHTSELQSRLQLVCRLLLEKKKKKTKKRIDQQ